MIVFTSSSRCKSTLEQLKTDWRYKVPYLVVVKFCVSERRKELLAAFVLIFQKLIPGAVELPTSWWGSIIIQSVTNKLFQNLQLTVSKLLRQCALPYLSLERLVASPAERWETRKLFSCGWKSVLFEHSVILASKTLEYETLVLKADKLKGCAGLNLNFTQQPCLIVG